MAATRNDAGARRAEAFILQSMGGTQRSIKSITDPGRERHFLGAQLPAEG